MCNQLILVLILVIPPGHGDTWELSPTSISKGQTASSISTNCMCVCDIGIIFEVYILCENSVQESVCMCVCMTYTRSASHLYSFSIHIYICMYICRVRGILSSLPQLHLNLSFCVYTSSPQQAEICSTGEFTTYHL